MDTFAKLLVSLIPSSVRAWMDGKKSYIMAFIVAATGAAQVMGYDIPPWVYAIEAALGMGALRVAISKGGAPYQSPKN